MQNCGPETKLLVNTASRMSAVAFSSSKMVRLLLANGADARAVDNGGITALHCASLTDRPDTLAEILDLVTARDGTLPGSDSTKEFLNFAHYFAPLSFRQSLGSSTNECQRAASIVQPSDNGRLFRQ